jgi:predicted ATPase/DNA-binding winged helix-turn-helix (wHTH) protein
VTDSIHCFGTFRLDTGERRLLHGDTVIPLRGKVFDTLRVLVENRGRLVRKEQLLKAVWPDSIVEENSLDHSICAIRKALGQRRGGVQYIETVPRQGYRLIEGAKPPDAMQLFQGAAAESLPGPRLVERAAALSELRNALEVASSGTRQVIFVTGEPGMGKSALARAFMDEIAETAGVCVAFGSCQSYYGPGEPYMPVFEAVGRLARQDGGLCREVLARCAPSWLAQLPAVADGAHAAPAQPETMGSTHARMLREMTDALEFLAAESTLALILEDLHWSDHSTVDLLARIAQRSDPARLLVIATYSPSTARKRSHPLYVTAHDLKLRALCKEIVLGLLTAGGVSEYLRDRFGGAVPVAASQRLHARTQGNPLLMTTVVDSWLVKGWLRERDGGWELSVDVDQLAFGVPDDLRRMIERQIVELDAGDREIIEVASVAGFRFCPAAIAPALHRRSLELEARCSHLAENGRFLVPAGVQEWPDGTVCDGYRFVSSVHREVVYERIPAGRKVCLHENIALRLEQGYRGKEDDIAAELAMHFREARDAPRALRYLQRAAGQALARSGHRVAIECPSWRAGPGANENSTGR